MKARIPLLTVTLACAGCAADFSYPYDSYTPKLAPGSGRAVALAIVDERPDVASGAQPPARVGTQEQFWASPLTTKSGKPLADDFTEALARGLTKAGFNPTVVHTTANESAGAARQQLVDTHQPRGLLIEVQVWQIIYNQFGHTLRQHYKVRLAALDGGGKELAAQQFDKDLTQSSFDDNQEETLFERLCEGVLDSPDFSKALRGT